MRHGTLSGHVADVCGTTLAAVPLLASRGLQSMHTGYNNVASFPDDMPPAWRWRSGLTGHELIAMNEPCYGQIIVPGNNTPVALLWDFDGDNSFHWTVDGIRGLWAEGERIFPNARWANHQR